MNEKSVLSVLTLVVFSVMVSVGASAVWSQDGESVEPPCLGHKGRPGGEEMITEFDANGDGQITIEEFPGPESHFDGMDTDGNGILSPEEIHAGRPEPPDGEKILAEFDGDGDGQISIEEFPGPEGHFNAMDTDGDGFLSAAEIQAGRPGPPGERGFENDDTNQDGKVSASEFSGPRALFDHLDKNGDGYIMQDEIGPKN